MIENIIVTSLWCLGFYKAFDEGMVFGCIAKVCIVLPLWLRKPLYDCPPCMGSAHGFVAFFIFYGTIDFRIIPFIFCVSGLNWLLSSIAE
jgi:hypothetical protein